VVNFDGPYRPGDFVQVRVTRGRPHHLVGEPLVPAALA